MVWFVVFSGKYHCFRFSRMNLTNHLVAHWWIFDRLEFNWFAASTGWSTLIYRLVSSANNLIDNLKFSTISLIY